MEIRRILSSIARRWRLVILLVGIGGALGVLIGSAAKPIYQADTTLYIMKRDKVLEVGESFSSQDLEVSEELVRKYFDIIYSRSVIEEVLEDTKGYSLSESAILSMISIYGKSDSNVFKISARGYDPAIVAVVANAAGRAFTGEIHQLTKSDNVSILDWAQVPYYPVSNKKMQMVFLGMLAGLMLGLSIIYFIEYFDTTVRSVEDIENGLKLRVIGIIPEHDI